MEEHDRMRHDSRKRILADFLPKDTAHGKNVCSPQCPSLIGTILAWIPLESSLQPIGYILTTTRLYRWIMAVIGKQLQVHNELSTVYTGKPPRWKCKSRAACRHNTDNNIMVTDANILTSEEEDTFVKTSVLVAKQLLLTGLTKLPVADCHSKRRHHPFCLRLQMGLLLSLGWCSTGLSVWPP